MKDLFSVLKHPLMTFLIGMLTMTLLTTAVMSLQTYDITQNTLQSPINGGSGIAPSQTITSSQVKVYNDKIELDLKNARWAKFEPTGSMIPTLNHESHALQIKPACPEEINIGDIISYDSSTSDKRIIHRVTDIQTDKKGIYYTAQGDNNPRPDPEKIRCHQIKRKTVAILY